MELIEVIRINLLSPMVLAFVLGIVAVLVNSDLRIPDQVYSIISIYLLFAIGLKGGFDLAKSPLSDFGAAAIVTIIIGAAIPLITFVVLKFLTPLTDDNIIAIGIHYGAVSAVTLSACITFLDEVGQPFEGFMPAMYVIMEIPAVIVGLILVQIRVDEKKSKTDDRQENVSQRIGNVVRSALSGKSFLLLGGGVLIGFLSGDLGERQVGPFFIDLFSGFLALFLLEMGTLVGRRIRDLSEVGIRLLIFAVAMPAFNALLGAWLGSLAGLSVGGTMILATLAASASFITAPAVVQNNLPRANPGYYLTTALVLTFPFNLIVGLPLYFQFALFFSGG